MRSILRTLALAAAMIPVLFALATAPASAATPRAINSALPNTLPTATLTGASISFTTNDEDKDGDTLVSVDILTRTGGSAATISDFFGHFDDGSAHGPYSMFPFAGVKASDLNPGAINFEISPYGNDTWRFNYSVTMTFSDSSSYVFRENNKSLSQDNRSFRTPFAVVAQAPVPDVVGKTQTAAKTALEAVGLTLGTVTHKPDSSCNYINTVSSETPGAGTIVNAGTAVTIVIGDKPKTPCP